MTKGALYHHFDSKDALATATIEQGTHLTRDAFRHVCESSCYCSSIQSRSVKFSNVTNTTGSSDRISADLLILARTAQPSQCRSSTTRFASASTPESADNAAGTVWKTSGNACPAKLSCR